MKQDIKKLTLLVKVGSKVIIMIQVYVMPLLQDGSTSWFGSSQLEKLIAALHGPIKIRIQKRDIKINSAKIAKLEIKVLKDDQLKIHYGFRRNSCKDIILLRQDLFGSKSYDEGHGYSALQVFNERVIVTVSPNWHVDETDCNEKLQQQTKFMDASEYFVTDFQDVVKSAQRKKAVLSKMKQKQKKREMEPLKQNNIEIENKIPDSHIKTDLYTTNTLKISEVCKQYKFKNRAQRIINEDKNVAEEDTSLKDQKNKTGTNDNDYTTSENEPYNINTDVANSSSVNTTVCHHESPIVQQDTVVEIITLSTENRTKLECQSFGGNEQSTANGQETRTLSNPLKRKQFHPLLFNVDDEEELNQFRDCEINRPKKFVKRSGLKDSSQITKKESFKKLEKKSCPDIGENLLIDDYGDVCLDNISSVTQLSAWKICYLVRNMEKELRNIFEGKSSSKRHQDYTLGGRHRAELAFNVHFGQFSEEQQDVITDTLRQMFCYRHTKYFDYILKVLVPEAMVLVLKKVNKGIDHEQAEKMLTGAD